MESLIKLEAVRKVYRGTSAPALDEVSIEIARGEAVAIMGPSGSGKSTLLNLIAGLDRATAGRVIVDGMDLARLGETGRARLRRSSVGLVFQFFNLLDNLTAIENVSIAAELRGVRRRDALRQATDLLARLDLEDQMHSFPSRMSGGQRQRVAVARALVNDPAVLLADEPTGALDTQSGEQVLDLLRDLNRGGRTLIVVTHDERLAAASSHRIVRLVDGRVVGEAPIAELMAR